MDRRAFCASLIAGIALAGCERPRRQLRTLAPAPDVLYRLGPGDRLRVTVFQEPDLSGEFAVNGAGRIAMPMIGGVPAQGLALQELEQRIEGELSRGFLRQPRVSVDVMNFRPFYILGEVNNPGSYSYVEGMTVLNAVALAGGFSYRARKGRTTITRENARGPEEFRAYENSPVLPGDVIRVPQRFF